VKLAAQRLAAKNFNVAQMLFKQDKTEFNEVLKTNLVFLKDI
jgi:hypothetical protein